MQLKADVGKKTQPAGNENPATLHCVTAIGVPTCTVNKFYHYTIIAYALWGGTGILLTVTAGLILFKQRLTHLGWLGIAFIVSGILLLKLS